METRMNAVAKKAGATRTATARKAAPAKTPAEKKAAAKRVDGVASKTVAAKGAVIRAGKVVAKAPAKRAAAGSRVPLPETLAASEPPPVPVDVVTLSGPPAYWQEACADLMKRDRILRKIIPAFGPAHLASRGDPFVTLARSIVGQQISVKAAQSVWERLVEACPKLVPAQFLRAGHEKLAGCGLSKRKAEYILDLAEHFRNGTVHVAKWAEMEDEDVIAELTQIRGIVRWTAEMFLMFNLLRPNVLPLDDIGLINAISQNYFSGEPVTRSEAREVAANWEPWRTVATWYMWRSLDTTTTY
ncbi:DNA-3-methyladenine glycosylase 2 family protein [Ralstonia syzygii subsp. celebesensis]|uniref:DNA-3-methyladenine glycosylase II n=2 Tax=Ralstonia syzygii subsp. celebesensis TaxID=1310168 RepID=A0A1U9VF88_9RALS|nr:DNA-3-methyladenine glycosylase [Ralstonia syzygii]AQW28973.1 Fe-S cluster assembly protein HesB [blood disease bacterium A2-HR MARDI]CCA79233.1 putative DNA-3-methyladenine glycosylase II [blood disease bacterium R229]